MRKIVPAFSSRPLSSDESYRRANAFSSSFFWYENRVHFTAPDRTGLTQTRASKLSSIRRSASKNPIQFRFGKTRDFAALPSASLPKKPHENTTSSSFRLTRPHEISRDIVRSCFTPHEDRMRSHELYDDSCMRPHVAFVSRSRADFSLAKGWPRLASGLENPRLPHR